MNDTPTVCEDCYAEESCNGCTAPYHEARYGHSDKPLTFSQALERLKCGEKLAREGWNGKGMHIELQKPDENSKMTLPYLYLEYPGGNRVPWLASQTDLLQEDWYVVHEPEGEK